MAVLVTSTAVVAALAEDVIVSTAAADGTAAIATRNGLFQGVRRGEAGVEPFARLKRIGKIMIKSAARPRMFLLPLFAVFALANSASVPQRYTLDASASNVSAKVPFFGLASKTARFPRMQGAVTIVPGAPEKAVIDVTFDATAIQAPDSVTLARLRGDKFFWVEKYPSIRFIGRSLKLSSTTRGTVSGELTARGVTRPATLAVTFNADPIAQAGKPVSFTGTTTIDMALRYKLNDKLELSLEGIAKVRRDFVAAARAFAGRHDLLVFEWFEDAFQVGDRQLQTLGQLGGGDAAQVLLCRDQHAHIHGIDGFVGNHVLNLS